MKMGKILSWDDFREYCKADAHLFFESGYTADDLTTADIIAEYDKNYFCDDINSSHDDLSSCFTPEEFAKKTLEFLKELEC